MRITVIRKRGKKKWHISYAEGSTSSCIDTPMIGDENTYTVSIDKTKGERVLVLFDHNGEMINDPSDLCGQCKKFLVARIMRIK